MKLRSLLEQAVVRMHGPFTRTPFYLIIQSLCATICLKNCLIILQFMNMFIYVGSSSTVFEMSFLYGVCGFHLYGGFHSYEDFHCSLKL